MDPLSRKLNEKFPAVKIDTGNASFRTNHLLFIDDLKLFSTSSDVLFNMTTETLKFFQTIGLEVNKEKSATNNSI
ncbi:hypothetical protein COBT_003969, partial [Conglomerata obtusa]